jgi:hypothetical protein
MNSTCCGSLLFRVTLFSRRGKVSEGIDFKDHRGRVVIITGECIALFLTLLIYGLFEWTGIPYAPHMDPQLILKKKYLDERLSNGSALVTSSATAATSIVPASVNNGMGSGIPGYASAASYASTYGSQFASSSFGGSTAMPSSSVASAPVVHSSYYAAADAAAAAMAVTASRPATSSASSSSGSGSGGHHKLSGQMWYNQTASRAVNQAMGRVIRHKNDWGAIFLLDDRWDCLALFVRTFVFIVCFFLHRFQSGKQMAELSSWIRPRVGKYEVLQSALHSFRQFISTAMSDTRLTPPVVVRHSFCCSASF